MKRLLFRRGFTDKLYFYNFRLVWIFVGACFALNALSGILGIVDLAIINYGIPAAFAFRVAFVSKTLFFHIK